MNTIYHELQDQWRATGIGVNSGTTKDLLDLFERRHNVALPSDFRSYLLSLNGMQDGNTDEHLITFMSLNDIDRNMCEIKKNYKHIDIPFAQFSVFSHLYVLRLVARSGFKTELK